MKNDCHKKTAVELRIQKSMIKTMGHAAAHSTRSAPVSISLLGIVTRFYELERQCSKFSTDVDIHLAEIHTIMAIHNNEGIHVGGLAEQLGVTKGSVSELLRRLERKGLAYKAKDPLKMTRLNVFLTEKGKAAHKQWTMPWEHASRMRLLILLIFLKNSLRGLTRWRSNRLFWSLMFGIHTLPRQTELRSPCEVL